MKTFWELEKTITTLTITITNVTITIFTITITNITITTQTETTDKKRVIKSKELLTSKTRNNKELLTSKTRNNKEQQQKQETTIRFLDKSWDLHVVSNEMPLSGDIRTQPTHRTSCAVEGANYKPPLSSPLIPTTSFSLAEDAHLALHLRSFLLRTGDVEVNPGPVCRGCTKTIGRDITCSSCSLPYHRTCSGLTRNKKSTQGFICRPCAGLATPTPTITQVMGTNKQCCVCNTKMRLNSIAIRCHSCGGISHRKCANVSRYAPHVNWCCHVCNHNIQPPTTLITLTTQTPTIPIPIQKIQCAQHVVAGWLTIEPHLSAPNVGEDSTSNVLHKQGLSWSIFEAPIAGPARPVFPPIIVGQPNSRTEHHRSPETPLKG